MLWDVSLVLVGLTDPMVLLILVEVFMDEEILTTLLQLGSCPVRIKAMAVGSMIGSLRPSS